MVTIPFTSTALNRKQVKDYLSILSGSAGRLLISLVYFVALANALSLGDFGLFATASATGVVLSRFTAFGFISPLYRTATVRHRLLGSYTTGYLAAFVLSLPFVLSIAFGLHWLIFADGFGWTAFLYVMLAEIVFWRLAETVIIVNNGLNRFLTAALLTILGTTFRAIAGLAFWWSGTHMLAEWSVYYLIANVASMIVMVAFFYPRHRARWQPSLWLARLKDALGVSAAEALFYVQMELDKVLVLSVGGQVAAGLYAILMRLADLTAVPIRSFNMMLVQAVMRKRSGIEPHLAILTEALIGVVSSAALGAMALLLLIDPAALGASIEQAAGYVLLILLVPAFRNLIEYHSELLYARELTTERAGLMAAIGALKAVFLVGVLTIWIEFSDRALALNAAFFGLYLVSLIASHTILHRKSQREDRMLHGAPAPA
ncbi:MAG: lipopolysaccharide biosynthesis protein [Pseudomonadota bacterium]